MATQRPGRQPTRLGQPAIKAPAKAAPAVRPSTGGVPRQAPATARGARSSTTRSVPTSGGGGRPATRPAAAKSNSALFIGIGVGVVLVLVVAFVMMGGKSEKNAPVPAEKSSKPKPVDVSGLERDGMAKCNEGLALIQKNQSQLGNHELSAGQKQSLIADLEKGKKLISDGMGLLTQANEKSKNTYDTKQYQEALITVRKKLMELRE
ncbi:MAG TPA: hypothetical protein VKW04_21005 [Planctomycetota bacterium]|nr:hypothetical protein [Planctomycetota bacterium]